METIFMNAEKSKTIEPHKFVLNLSHRLDLRSLDLRLKLILDFSCCSSKKIIGPTLNDEFELPDGSYYLSNIQDYIEYIIKKHETLTIIPLIHVYISRINNRLVFKIKEGYKLELQTPKTIKLLGSTKKIIDKTKILKLLKQF